MKMNDFIKCETCNKYHWSHQKCDPIYLVYYEDYMGDEPQEVRAYSHEDAAREFAEYYNTNCDYVLMNETIEVSVEKDGIIKKYLVGAEPDIYYSSEEIK